jgi:hypothetical protein
MTTRAPDTWQRIVVLSRDDYNRARMVSPQLLADPLTRVVALPLRPPDSEDAALVALGNELRPSAVLLRNTWGGDRYIDAAAAYEIISLAKFNTFANVCQMLGATRLEVKEIHEENDRGKIRGRSTFRGNAATGSSTLKSASSRRVAQTIRGSWVWQSGSADVERAAAYATAEHLSGDPVITGLIQQRRFADNALTEHELKLNISSEAQRAVQATLEVKSVLGPLGPAFKSTFESLQKHSEQLILRVRVVFPPSR